MTTSTEPQSPPPPPPPADGHSEQQSPGPSITPASAQDGWGLIAAAVLIGGCGLATSVLFPPVAIALGVVALVLALIAGRGSTRARSAWVAVAAVLASLALIISAVYLIALIPARVDSEVGPVLVD